MPQAAPKPLLDRSPLELAKLKITFMEYFIDILDVSEETAESMANACINAGLRSEERRNKPESTY